jgi:hypothetical protein
VASKKEAVTRDELDALAAQGLGLGDLVSRATKKLGLRECEGCARRRALLNKVRLPALLKRRPGDVGST